MTPIIGDLITAGLQVLDKVLPDPQAKAAAQLELMKLQQAGAFKELEVQLQMAQGQVETNKIEAADPSLFKSGWRPGAGWVCVAGLAYQFLAQPLLSWAGGINHWPSPPILDLEQLMGLLAGMLGLGGFRTLERVRGKA